MFLPSFLVLDSHNNIYIAMEIMAEKNEKLDPRSFIAIGDTLSNISSFCDCLLGVDIMCSMLLCPINLFCTTFFSYFGVWETINDSCSSSYSRPRDKQHRRANWKLISQAYKCCLFVSRSKQSFFFLCRPYLEGVWVVATGTWRRQRLHSQFTIISPKLNKIPFVPRSPRGQERTTSAACSASPSSRPTRTSCWGPTRWRSSISTCSAPTTWLRRGSPPSSSTSSPWGWPPSTSTNTPCPMASTPATR